MKKFFTILGMLGIATLFNAQNLITNGDLETWTDASQKPDGWFSMGGGSKETSIVHGGTNSVKLMPVSVATNGNLDFVDVPANENTSYTVSYWILDNDVNTRGRHWIQFRNSSSNISPGSGGQPFQPSTYSTDNSSWINTSATAISPAGTTLLRLSLRVYSQNNIATGAIYFDDIVLAPTASLATSDVNTIKNTVKISSSIVKDELDVYSKGKNGVSVINAMGQKVFFADFTDFISIDTSSFAKGIYFVQIKQGENIIIKRIIKE